MIDSSLTQENLCSEITDDEAREIVSKQITSLERRLFNLGILSFSLMSNGLFYLNGSFQQAREKMSRDLATLYMGGFPWGLLTPDLSLAQQRFIQKCRCKRL